MRKNAFVVVFILFGLFLLQACGGDRPQRPRRPRNYSDSSRNAAQNQAERIPVEVMPVVRGDISKYLLLSSNLETEVMADVYSRIQGIVDSIFAEEGQYVKKGDVMLTLEAREYELAEQKARVEYEQQLRNFQRLEKMHAKKLLSDEEYEKAAKIRDQIKRLESGS
jgi:multidrug efflux pump subunit AcrA (membrane-fusion protein)